MATKHYCDHCGNEVEKLLPFERIAETDGATVKLEVIPGKTKTNDLCLDCAIGVLKKGRLPTIIRAG